MRSHSPPQVPAEQRAAQGGEEEIEVGIMGSQKRLCDFCGERKALLYCRPDSAKLCFSCDREVHSTNQLFTKHARSLLCDSCHSSPASILCSTENFVLCQNCDWEKHNRSVSSIHDRRPLESFSGCPSANELSSILGFDEDPSDKAISLSGNDEMVDLFSDFLVWDTPSIVTLDDLIVPADSEHNFQAMGVPPLPKNRKATCGRHKDEMLRQIRELSRSEPDLSSSKEDVELLDGFHSVVPEPNLWRENAYAGHEHTAETNLHPSFRAHAFQSRGNSGEAANEVVRSSFLRSDVDETFKDDVNDGKIGGSLCHAHVSVGREGQFRDLSPITAAILPVPPKVCSHELTAQERETAISRYKEKKKSRRYEKHIRYQSRKVRAESRARIRGRFAKIEG